MNKFFKRLKERYKQLKAHPVTRGRPFKGLVSYITFHTVNRLTKELEYKWIEGLKFYARKGDAGIVGNITFGLFEFEESIFLLHLLKKEDLFLDIGANLGHYSILMSGIKKCKSIAIEPVPKTYFQLIRQIDLNNLQSLISPMNIGVSDTKGELYFSTDRGTMDRIVTKDYINYSKVTVDCVDNIIDVKIPVAIKIDVEGYEKFVLDGAKNTLKNSKVKAVILELNNSGTNYSISDEEIFKIMLNYGFKPYKYDFFNRILIELESYNTHKFNTIFLRDISFVEKRIKESKSINIKGRLF